MIGDNKAFPTESEHSDDDAGAFSVSNKLMSDEELDKSIIDDAFEDKKRAGATRRREGEKRRRRKKEVQCEKRLMSTFSSLR